MNRIVSFNLTVALTLFTSCLLAQEKLEETLERFEDGSPKVIRYKTVSLKTLGIFFLNNNKETIASISFDTLNNTINGNFYDPYNQGTFIDGALNCSNCQFSFDGNQSIYELSIADGKVIGSAIKYDVSNNHYIASLKNKSYYSEVPYYIVANVERYFSQNNGNRITLEKKAAFNFLNGILDGVQRLKYNTFQYSRDLDNLPIEQTELYFEKGVLKGFKTFDEKSNVVDSLYSTSNTWKYRNELIENQGEMFHIFHRDNQINLDNLTLKIDNNYAYSPEKQTVYHKMTAREGYFLQPNPFKDDYGNQQGTVYHNPVIFYPSNLNTNNQGIFEIDFDFEHYLLNDFFAHILHELLTDHKVLFDSKFKFFPDIPEAQKGDKVAQYDYQGSYWERSRLSQNYMYEVLRPYSKKAPQTPLEFLQFVIELRDDHKIFLNRFYLNTSHERLDPEFMAFLTNRFTEDQNHRFTEFSIDDLRPYFEHLDSLFKRHKQFKEQRAEPIDNMMHQLFDLDLSLEDFNGNQKYRGLSRSKNEFLHKLLLADPLILRKNKSVREKYDPEDYNYDSVYLLQPDAYNEWIEQYKRLIQRSQEWISDVTEWDAKLEQFKALFFTLLTKYPIPEDARDNIITTIKQSSEFKFPNSSVFWKDLPHTGLFEGSNRDFQFMFKGNTANKFPLTRLYNASVTKDGLEQMFEFSNYMNRYKDIKKYNGSNLPNYGSSINELLVHIKELYHAAFVHLITYQAEVPLNQDIYSTSGFPCSDNGYSTGKIKALYRALELNFDRMVIYKSVNSEWGIDANKFEKYPKRKSQDDNPRFFAHTFYKNEKKMSKDLKILDDKGIAYLLPKVNYFKALGDCERNEKFFRYSIIIIGNPTQQ